MPGIKAGNHMSDLSNKNHREASEEFEPCTQSVDPRPLAGVIAFVDVRSGKNGCENRGEAVSHQLDSLGATISPRFTKDVTHVIFKDGKATVIEKAQKLGLYVVSVLWVDACKRANDRVSEAKYPAIVNDLTGSPVVLGKLKRIKSMQPKPLEEEVAKSLERSRKRKKREEPLTKTAAAGVECGSKQSLATASSHEGAVHEDESHEESDDSFNLPPVVLPGTPSNLRHVPDKSMASAQMQGSPGLAKKVGSLGQSEQDDQATPSVAKKVGSLGQSEQDNQATPSVAKKVGNLGQSEQDNQATPTHVKKASVLGQKKQNTLSLAQKVGSSNQPEEDKPCSSRFSKLSMKRCLPKETCDGSESDDEIVTPVAQSAIEKMPATYKLTNSLKSKSLPKEKGTVKARKSEQSAVKTVDRDVKRRRTKETTSEAKKKRRSRDKEAELKEKPTLVMTSVAVQDQETVYAIVEKLETFEISKTVCGTTTHIVCGGPRRTVNILAGTIKGCWILSLEWVWKSLENGHWLEEEPYEMADEFPAARLFRLERQQSGSLYHPTFFSSVGSIFISSNSSPSAQQLEQLVSLGGGKISASQRKADVCIGCRAWNDDVKSVSERWILDSISEHHLLRMEDYSLDGPNSKAASPEL